MTLQCMTLSMGPFKPLQEVECFKGPQDPIAC